MKKNYISPAITEINIEAEAMIASSLNLNDETTDTSNGTGQLSDKRRGSWGNLWNK